MTRAAFVYSDKLSRHVLRVDHPMRPLRLRMAYDLLNAYQVFADPDAALVEPREATVDELEIVHSSEYIAAVQSISRGDRDVKPSAYNFDDEGDNPTYLGMYDAALLSTGGSLTAMEAVLDGGLPVAFNIAGGLHHAMPGQASGFCVFNDPAVIIGKMVKRGLKVAYLDIDAHHGDGVQSAFYRTDQVLTISTHEAGRWLFPGTGDVQEWGAEAGRGYSVNLPLPPFTDDEHYLWAFEQLVPPIIGRFRPDVIVTQFGVDAHENDPLSHLKLTTRTYEHVTRWAKGLGLPWVALGGGGYNLGVVARIWALEYAIMLGIDLPNTIPASFVTQYGIGTLRDGESSRVPENYEAFVHEFIEASVAAIRREVFPYHGLER